MTTLIEAEKLEEPEFAWGKKRGVGGKNKQVQFYETFAYDGEDYALYDDVFIQKADEPEPYIGKLVNIWKNSDSSKWVKLQWFFRPREISYYLGDAEVIGNELFFASGDGIGLSSINHLEAIVGKCNIVCISKDSRNPQPSAEELQGSHYVFYRIFDVKSCTISDRMDDKVGGIEVKYVFNRTKILNPHDALKLSLNGKVEEIRLIGENSLQLLNNVKPEENNNHMLGKEVTYVKEMAMKEGRLHGSSLGVCVKSSEFQVKMEKEVTRDAINFGDLDGTQSMEAKLGSTMVSSEVKDMKSVQSIGENAVHTTTHALSSRSKSKFDKKLAGPRKALNLAEKSSFFDEKLSKTQRSGHGYLVGMGKKAKGNGSPSGEKLKPSHVKDSIGEENDNKLGENLRENVVGPPKISGLANGTLQSGSSNDFLQLRRQAAKLGKHLDYSTKGTLKRSVDLSKDESHTQNDLGHENYDTKLTKGSHSLGGPLTKKGKFDDTIKLLEYPKNNNLEKKNEKKNLEEIKKPMSHAKYYNATKLRLSNGAPRGRLDGDFAERREVNYSVKMLERCKDNIDEENYLDEINDSPRLAAKENMKILKLSECELNEHCIGKLGKPSKSELLVSAIKSCGVDAWKVESRIFEVTRRPIVEKSNWMKLSWEFKMNAAHGKGTLILLQNLDPEYTSREVEDIVFHAFKEESTAKTVQHTATSNPYSGKAFVILKSREIVDRILKILDDRCLMLPNQRPLVACTIVFPRLLEKQPFVGHLAADKFRPCTKRDNTNQEAVATSHYSQDDTIEYEMAMAWRLLQSTSDRWWNMLYEQQRKEMQKLANNLKKTKSLK